MKSIIGRLIFLSVLCGLLSCIAVPARTALDYDGDGRSDFVVARYDTSLPYFVWYILQSRDGFRAEIWGLKQSDYWLFDCDFDGDGKADMAVTRSFSSDGYLYWYILNSQTNTLTAVQWGVANIDLVIPQDYDGDGKTDVAVFRRTTGWWYIRQSGNNQLYAEQFGVPDARQLAGGDYDGDGKADLAVLQGTPNVPPSPVPGGPFYATLYIRRSSDGTWRNYDLPDMRITGLVTGDYDGDGRADVAIWWGNLWLWIRSSDNKVESVRFGQIPGDIPVQGDYDGDGKTDPAVFRRGTVVSPQSYFYIMQSRDGFKAVPWGNIYDSSAGDGGNGSPTFIPAAGF